MARLPLPTLSDRTAGVLLHLTSLPGSLPSGALGPPAVAFLEWARRAKLRWWQMLPIGPPGFGNSPYSALSSFAGSPLLVSLERLVELGLLREDELPAGDGATRIDWGAAKNAREGALRRAFEAYRARPARRRAALAAFQRRERRWLDDWVLYAAIKRAHGDGPWVDWPAPLRDRRPSALAEARRTFAEELEYHAFCQWRFAEDFADLRHAARAAGIALMGDVPIFVAHDSADVWAHPDQFRLDSKGRPTHVAGVPPDYFSETGQRWGNPLYRWPRMRQGGYRFWLDRLGTTLDRFDAVRLDHFIGFLRYWEIPAAEPTAVKGRWQPGPGAHFFKTVRRHLGGRLPLIAEDLGAVTPAVTALRDELELPGIRLLQFAFGNDASAPTFLPHAYPRRTLAATGTHDNDTMAGWWATTPEVERAYARRYLDTDGSDPAWAFIRGVMASVADLAVVPMQDYLGLGNEARMNLPGTLAGNWEWRLSDGAADEDLAARIAERVETYGREWEPKR